ncbi:hypothetical protein B0H14DRAFT_3673436 [Mycena olivaceomarginata]|nr:hypothetical protein B0H14DRAFT_3673436 [Mycena olivaceomarginata]
MAARTASTPDPSSEPRARPFSEELADLRARTLSVWTNPAMHPQFNHAPTACEDALLSSGSGAPPYLLRQYRRPKSIDDDRTRRGILHPAMSDVSLTLHRFLFSPKQYGLPTATHCERGRYLPPHLACEGAVNTHVPRVPGLSRPRHSSRSLASPEVLMLMAIRSTPGSRRWMRGATLAPRSLPPYASSRADFEDFGDERKQRVEGGWKESTTGVSAADKNAGPGTSREAARLPDYREVLAITLRYAYSRHPPTDTDARLSTASTLNPREQRLYSDLCLAHAWTLHLSPPPRRLTGRTVDQPSGTRIYIFAYSRFQPRSTANATACVTSEPEHTSRGRAGRVRRLVCRRRGTRISEGDSYTAHPPPVPPSVLPSASRGRAGFLILPYPHILAAGCRVLFSAPVLRRIVFFGADFAQYVRRTQLVVVEVPAQAYIKLSRLSCIQDSSHHVQPQTPPHLQPATSHLHPTPPRHTPFPTSTPKFFSSDSYRLSVG